MIPQPEIPSTCTRSGVLQSLASILNHILPQVGQVFLFFVIMALTVPALAQGQTAPRSGLNGATVLIIRHAEKGNKGSDLSKAGEKRAKAYVGYFSNFTVDLKPIKLDCLFATADSKQSHRARLTIEPLSKALGLPINASFENTQTKELAASLQTNSPNRNILICWHHGEIPQLVAALGAKSKTLFAGNKWPDEVYDWVIYLRYDAQGNLVETKRINEGLMPGDSQP
jgi:hypothetical protein